MHFLRCLFAASAPRVDPACYPFRAGLAPRGWLVRRVVLAGAMAGGLAVGRAQTIYSVDQTISSGEVSGSNLNDSTITSGATITVKNTGVFVAGGDDGQNDGNEFGDLYVGGTSTSASTGTLVIQSGGTVEGFSGWVGPAAGSMGTVTLDGSGSSWFANGSITLGQSGTGTLTLSNGAVLGLGGTGMVPLNDGTQGANLGANTGASGTLNIGAASTDAAAAAGIFNGKNVTKGSGSGRLQFNTTGTSAAPTYFTQDGTATGAGVAVQSVSLVNTAGYTVFTGSISLATTTINGGTVQIGTGGTSVTFSGSVTNNGTLVFDRGSTGTISASLAGSGAVVNAGTGTVTLSGGISGTQSLTQNAGTLILTGTDSRTGATTVTGGTLQIGAAGTIGTITSNITDNANVVFNRSNAYTYAGVISGSGNVTSTGTSTLTLSGASTYTGTTTINAGTLSINSIGNAGVASAAGSGSTISLGSGTTSATLVYTGSGNTSTDRTFQLAGTTGSGGITNNGTGTLSLTGNITAPGGGNKTLTLSGTNAGANILSGTIVDNSISNTTTVIKGGTGSWELANDTSTFTGTISVSAGTLAITSLGNTGAASAAGAGNTINLGSLTTAGMLTYVGNASSTSNRTINLAGTTGGATIASSGTGTLSLTSSFTATGSGSKTLILRGSNTGLNTISGNIVNPSSGSVTLNKADSGEWVLSGTNSYSSTTVTAGTLRIEGAAALGTGTVSLSGGTLQLAADASTSFSHGVNVTGGTTFVSDTVSAGVAGVTQTLGALNTGGAVLTIARGSNVGSGTAGLGFGATTLSSTGSTFSVGSGAQLTLASLSGSSNAFTFTGSGDTVVSGAITGSGAITKTGAGKLSLNGTNTNTGTTTVSGGTLAVNGSMAHAVTIASGGTLGGTGTLSGGATIQSAGILAPGNSPGTITFSTGGLTLNSGAVLDFDLGTSSDKIFVTGGTLLGSGGLHDITVNIADSGGFGVGVYSLIDYTGSLQNTFSSDEFTVGTAPDGYNYSFTVAGSTLELIATATSVPEPAACAAMAGAAGLALAGLRRRRKRRGPAGPNGLPKG